MKKIKYRKKKSSHGYRLPETELIGLDPILDLLILALWTAYILGEKTVSLLLLAPPESGKTELMKKLRKNNGVHVLRRFTACGFIKDLLSGKMPLLFKSAKILGHILTYEFVNAFTYKASSVNSTIELINAYTEDGLSNESSYWIEGDALDDFENLKGGVIAGINPFGFFTSQKTRNVKANLYKGGLISRFLVASYTISEAMKSKIFDSITHGEYRTDRNFRDLIIENFPKKRVHVILPKRYAQEIRELASEIAEEYSQDLKTHALKGFRLTKSLISFVKTSALRDGRRVVNERDVERIKYLSNWMNLKMNKLKMSYPFTQMRARNELHRR